MVDDGSSDATGEVARSYAARHPNVKVVHQPNLGPSAARRAGIGRATGTYLCFADADDSVAPRVFGRLVDTMRRERLDVLGYKNESELIRGSVPFAPPEPAAFEGPVVTTGRQYIADHHYGNTLWWYMIDRAFLARSGARLELGQFVEDAIFTPTLLSAAERMATVPVDVYRYTLRPGSIMRTTSPAHTAKLLHDYEKVVSALGELSRSATLTGPVPPGYAERLRNRQESFVFFLIARLMRSDLPLRPALPDVLLRFRASGVYPFRSFPGPSYPGVAYRVLTFIFGHERLLYPFAEAVRIGLRIRRFLARR